ncbi:MAG: hypothetical protein HDT40_11655 [Lachnospiraceae bacterium]|nr:hypothetical protein [Lachnospiraceae bacterium]
MKQFEIEETGKFMSELLTGERYDSFYLFEARIKTGIDYYINGKINKDFFDSDDRALMAIEEYIDWKNIKPIVHGLIKGDKLPLSLKLILMFNRENITRLVEMNNLPISENDIGALFLNVLYEKGTLTVTTGTSIKTFSLDKTLDNVWDDTVEKYYT